MLYLQINNSVVRENTNMYLNVLQWTHAVVKAVPSETVGVDTLEQFPPSCSVSSDGPQVVGDGDPFEFVHVGRRLLKNVFKQELHQLAHIFWKTWRSL